MSIFELPVAVTGGLTLLLLILLGTATYAVGSNFLEERDGGFWLCAGLTSVLHALVAHSVFNADPWSATPAVLSVAYHLDDQVVTLALRWNVVLSLSILPFYVGLTRNVELRERLETFRWSVRDFSADLWWMVRHALKRRSRIQLVVDIAVVGIVLSLSSLVGYLAAHAPFSDMWDGIGAAILVAASFIYGHSNHARGGFNSNLSPRRVQPERSYYDLLGVGRAADDMELRAALCLKRLQFHPDRNRGNEAEATRRFQQVEQAYEILSDPAKRTTYDAWLSGQQD